MKGNHVKKNKPAAHFLPKPLKGKALQIIPHNVLLDSKAQLQRIFCTYTTSGIKYLLLFQIASIKGRAKSKVEIYILFDLAFT